LTKNCILNNNYILKSVFSFFFAKKTIKKDILINNKINIEIYKKILKFNKYYKNFINKKSEKIGIYNIYS